MIESNHPAALLRSSLAILAAAALSQTAAAQSSGNACGLPSGVSIHGLTSDNTIFSLINGVQSAKRISGVDGTLIGIDFRVSDGPTDRLYALSDTGKLYRVSVDPANQQPAQLVSSLTPRFAGGFQALADFNPVLAPNANALRLIGSNDQNFAVVDNGGTLNTTAVQTAVVYALGDLNVGVSPNLTAGAYDNNAPGAAVTTFYAIDYDLDTLVTIADRNAAGSSNTGGGQLKTIGRLVDAAGRSVNFAPAAGMDIFSQAGAQGFNNIAIAVSGATAYCIDLRSFDPNQPVGSVQKVIVTPVASAMPMPDPAIVSGGFIDIAVFPFVARF